MAKYNRDRAIVFNTYQMYRTSSLGNIEKACIQAKEKGYHLGVKLVRGAYMEKERERASERGYPDPIQPDKASTDRDYNAALKFCVEHAELTETFNGSHNEYSNWYLANLLDEYGISHNDSRFWFAQLDGMSDHISFALARKGYNVAKYVPYGPVASVMPYLLRRADENTSISGQTNKELKLIRRELKRRKNKN
jgi:proline dehydrogenase